MIEQKDSRVINGLDVTSYKFPVMESLRLGAKLTKLLMPIMSSATELVDDLSDKKTLDIATLLEMDLKNLGPVFEAISDALDPAELSQLVTESLRYTSVITGTGSNATKIDLTTENKINEVFTDINTLGEAVFFALKTNFGDFTDAVKAKFRALAAAAKAADSESGSTQTSTTSG